MAADNFFTVSARRSRPVTRYLPAKLEPVSLPESFPESPPEQSLAPVLRWLRARKRTKLGRCQLCPGKTMKRRTAMAEEKCPSPAAKLHLNSGPAVFPRQAAVFSSLVVQRPSSVQRPFVYRPPGLIAAPYRRPSRAAIQSVSSPFRFRRSRAAGESPHYSR